MSKLIALWAAGAVALGAGAAAAQTKWDMPTPYSDGTYHTQNVRWFADEVKKASGGQLEIVVHSNNSLIKLPDILRAVQTGQVPVGEILLSQFGNEDPIFEIEAIPFFATGYDEAWKLYQVQKPYLEDRLAKRGIKLLYSVPWPGQALYSKTPLTSLADYKGVKFRTYNPSTARLAELMGAVPTTVQASDVPQAFATNIVTAMITSAATGIQTKAWEFSKYYYDTKAFHPRNVVIANERAFQRLLEAQRKAILDVSAKAEPRGWELAKELEANGIKTLESNGMTIVKPDDKVMGEYRAIGQRMIQEWIEKAGADGKALVAKFQEQAKR